MSLDSLLGQRFRLTREIVSRVGSDGEFRSAGSVSWSTSIVGDCDWWRYREQGRTSGPHGSVRFGRELLMRRSPSGTEPALEVAFPDGRPFYRAPAELVVGDGAEVLHLCGDDRYLGEVRIDRLGCFHERWEVAGPKKQYTSVSVLRPWDGPLGAAVAQPAYGG